MGPKEPIIPGELRKLKLVLNEPVPAALFNVSAKVKPEMATALEALYKEGKELPADLKERYYAHLKYAAELGEKFYEAGFAADFTELLFIFRAESVEEIKEIYGNDPLFKDGTFYDDWAFEWHIHSPLYKAATLPPMPEQVQEVVVDQPTPQTLIVGFGKSDFSPMGPWMMGEADRPIYQLLHLYNRDAEGGYGTFGYDWNVGPTADTKDALHIMNVPTVEMAKFYNESDAMARWGLIRDFRYFEWQIHYPTRKATPKIRDCVIANMKDAGVAME